MLAASALDKDPGALKLIQNYCSGITGIYLQRTFLNSKETISYLRKFSVDLLFLDVETCTDGDLAFFESIQNPFVIIFIVNQQNSLQKIASIKNSGQLNKPISSKLFPMF